MLKMRTKKGDEGLYLYELKPGECGTISIVRGADSASKRLRDIGFTKGTKIEVIQKSPLGDPVAYLVRGSVFALRRETAGNVWIERR